MMLLIYRFDILLIYDIAFDSAFDPLCFDADVALLRESFADDAMLI